MKNLMKKTLAAVVAALSIGAGARAFASTGDVWAIVPVVPDGAGGYAVKTSGFPTSEDALDYGGEPLYFKMRLWNHIDTATNKAVPWGIVATDGASYSVLTNRWMVNPLQIGVYAKGAATGGAFPETWAKLVEIDDESNEWFTDLVFEYKIERGDFALPLILAGLESDDTTIVPCRSVDNGTGPALSGAVKYYLKPNTRWTLKPVGETDYLAEEVIWAPGAPGTEDFGSGRNLTAWSSKDDFRDVISGYSTASRYGITLEECRFFIKTVKFDTPSVSSGYWREVVQGKAKVTKEYSAPALTAIEKPEIAATVYLWSTNEAAVRLAVDNSLPGYSVEQREIKIGWDATANDDIKATVWMASLNAAQNMEFALQGVTEGEEAEIFLSAFPGFNWTAAAGTIINDFDKRLVKCGPPEATELVATFTDTLNKIESNTAWATTNRYARTAELKLDLSDVVKSGSTVTIVVKPSIKGDDTADWRDYIRLSTTTASGMSLPNNADTTLSLTVSEGSSAGGTLYIYALRTDGNSTVVNFDFDVVDQNGDDYLAEPVATSPLNIKAKAEFPAAPEFVGAPVKNRPTELLVRFADAVADADANDYTLWFFEDAALSNSTKNADHQTIAGLSLDGEGRLVDASGNYPAITYTSTNHTASALCVVSPVSGVKTFAALEGITVGTDDVEALVPDGSGGMTANCTVTEGTPIQLTVRLQDTQTADYWVYLVNTNDTDIAGGKFSDAPFIVCADTLDSATGIKIPADESEATATFTALDNPSASSAWSFAVVASSSATWDAAAVQTAFPAGTFTLLASNVSAAYTTYPDIMMYDASENLVEFNEGDSFVEGPVRSFRIVADDTKWDLANNFRTRWTFVQKTDTATVSNSWVVVGNPNDDTLATAFFNPAAASPAMAMTAGKWTVRAQILDKDDYAALDAKYSTLPASIRELRIWTDEAAKAMIEKDFEIIDNPQLSVTTGDTIFGNAIKESEENAYIVVSNTWWDAALPGNTELEVKVVVGRMANTKGGNLSFVIPSDGSVALDPADTTESTYIVKFTRARSAVQLYIDPAKLDGSSTSGSTAAYSRTRGFTVTATMASDTVLPTTGGKTASEYYIAGALALPLNVENEAPAPALSAMHTAENYVGTNSWATTPLSRENNLPWAVSDVAMDLDTAKEWTINWGGADHTGKGVFVYVEGDNVVKTNFFATSANASGEITPQFLSATAAARLYIHFRDKDGGVWDSAAYYYAPQIVKSLTTAAGWPSGGNTAIPISAKYAALDGAGSGRTFATGGTFESAKNFWIDWTYDKSASTANVFAYGYLVSDGADDGTLAGEGDVWLTAAGAHAHNAKKPDSGFYRYSDTDNYYDSFFYAWLFSEEPGGTTYTATVSPQMGTNVINTAKVNLAREKMDQQDPESGYADTYVEAVFSREHSIYDNMGDINGDGVPDFFALYAGWAGGALAASDGAGAEIVSVAAVNDDEDYLPALSSVNSQGIIPGAVSNWVTRGLPFSARTEIRGYGDGLNFGMFQRSRDERVKYGWISELELTTNEKKALMRRILERRAALLRKVYNGEELVVFSYINEEKELEIITNLLAATYYNGAAGASGDIMYRMEPVTSEIQTIDREEIDWDGNVVTNQVNAWIRRYWPVGADTTNPDAAIYATNIVTTATNANTGAEYAGYNITDAYGLDEIDFANFLSRIDTNGKYAEQQALARQYIDYTWAGYERTGTWGFTVENRTDPTIDDTDGDGMPDGYEYYMWYCAVVGAGDEPMTGRKFMLEDIENHSTVISTDTIASLYNPNIARSWDSQDTDNDGIYDIEEFLIGSNPIDWDSDGDGLSDLYEVMYNINPLSAAGGANGAMNGDDDAFAVWKADAGDPLGMFTRIFTATNGTYWIFTEDYTIEDPASGNIVPVRPAQTVKGTGFRVVRFNGGWLIPSEDTANYVERFAKEQTVVFDPSKGVATNTVTLFHHQVHNYFGFDPRTGWWHGGDNGALSLTSRWERDGSPVAAGKPVNTAKYTAIDEFRLLKYRYSVGLRDLAKDLADLAAGKTTIRAIISAGTTNPNAAFDSAVFGNLETIFKAGHGADTDADGVPDGWELYIGINPNISWTIPMPNGDALYRERGTVWPMIHDNDDYRDGLDTVLREYAGTDTCGVYAGCPTIYTNHPSVATSVNVNWFNKFFPTDPRDKDTDGDGIKDGTEGAQSWSGLYTINRWGQTITRTVNYRAIYGNPSDGGSNSIGGGGMNPCSIDTDLDGLPDPWERQYAGLVFVNNEIATNSFKTTTAPYAGIYDDIRAAVKAGNHTYTNEGEQVYHIMMGMDPTVRDATTSQAVGEPDYDWDGDGLQNWQEYMVQAMRHLRYDDNKTPLLGRDSPAFNRRTGEYEQGAWNGDKGYLAISYIDPIPVSKTDILVEAGYPNFAAFVAENPDYLSKLGYFAAPPKTWDYAGAAGGVYNRYMLPPQTIVGEIMEANGYEVQDQDENGLPIWTYEGDESLTYTGMPTVVEDDDGVKTYYARYRYVDPDTNTTNWFPMLVNKKMVVMDTTLYNEHFISREENLDNLKYFGTDPRFWDTDLDGMDDYYELFHGLNPLLGTPGDSLGDIDGDVIARNASASISVWRNGWIGWSWDSQEIPPYDPVRFPWMMGTPECDADGDGLRNYDESILANISSPSTTHSDPTPLWMTDATHPIEEIAIVAETVTTNYLSDAAGNPLYEFKNGVPQRKIDRITTSVVTNGYYSVARSPSYTKLYYRNEIVGVRTSMAASTNFLDFASLSLYNLQLAWDCGALPYLASFEQNEGFDTDNDWRTDSGEVKSLMRKNSDPIDFSDPAHRQSIWFGGKDDKGAAISYMPAHRVMNGSDFFRQFTIEAWIQPEEPANGADQYIVSRASNYAVWDLESWDASSDKTNAVVRMNFALGIDKNGQIFAETQNSTELSTRVTGQTVEPGEWVHVAATYDGATLTLYRNGKRETSLDSTLAPANGVTFFLQNPQARRYFPVNMYRIVPSVTILGARATGPGAFSAASAAAATSWDEIGADFYKGRIAEVRAWDGARTAAEIASAYNTTYTREQVNLMRLETYAKWRDGAVRNANTANDVLPAELVQYYDMGTLPGATDKAYVRQEPSGFAANVLDAVRNPDTGSPLEEQVKVGWWNAIQTNSVVKNSAYTSSYVVPWIENMIGHLPRISGMLRDSVYWSENYAGYTPASFHELEKFSIANAMNPYNVATLGFEDSYAYNKYYVLSDGFDIETSTNSVKNANTGWMQFLWDYRLGFYGTTDLVPIGSAYAKRGDSYWDGQGPESAWQETGDDLNANDLPDWWEGYAKSAYSPEGELVPETLVTRNGASMTAYEAYIRDLAAGMLPTKAVNEAYRDIEDLDGNGLVDWWADLYGVKGDAAADDDNDGLSNYTEYLLSEVFSLGATFSPIKAKSATRYDSDYFFRIGQLYAGSIFTDHDFMEDTWEDEQGKSFSTRYAWDANSDADEDGWSAFAERRYDQFTGRIFSSSVSHFVDAEELKDFPIPTLKLTLRYNGDQPLDRANGQSIYDQNANEDNQANNVFANIVIQTFTKEGAIVPDSTFIIRPGESLDRRFTLGGWRNGIVRGTLAPGYVRNDVGDIMLMVKTFSNEDRYYWRLSVGGWYDGSNSRYRSGGTTFWYKHGTHAEYLADLYLYGKSSVELLNQGSDWLAVEDFDVAVSGTSQTGRFTLGGEDVGKLNVVTGEFELDMSKFSNITTAASEDPVDLQSALFRFIYTSKVPTIQQNKLQLYLGEPNTGFVKEGKNIIVAYIDNNEIADNKYTNGEPLGMTTVDVGWGTTEAEIEMTDTSPVITRADLVQAVSDRQALYGTESGDNTNLVAGSLSGGRFERVRVVRTLVNGYGIQHLPAANRVIFDKEINLDQRPYLYEGDILERDGVFDIDWDYFTSEVMTLPQVVNGALDPVAVTYRVVLGSGDIATDATNNLYSIATVRHFDAADARTRPLVAAPGNQASVTFGARPTFRWTMKMLEPETLAQIDNNSYTAFKVQVLTLDGGTVVYDSGIRRAPARDLNGVYTFVPDCYAGDELDPSVNYKWRVSMYNSKFRSDYWSPDSNNTFRMNALTNSLGTIKVCARYFGPDVVLANSTVRIEAYESPDFKGAPAARTFVSAADKASVSTTNAPHVANATLTGLLPGKYYVRAFLDCDNESWSVKRAKDPWESWGYASSRDGATSDIFMPSTIMIDGNIGAQETVEVYIEDVDTNGNCLPDAWEIVQNRGKLDDGASNITDTMNCGIEISSALTDSLKAQETGTPAIAGLKSYIYGTLTSSGIAMLLLDADATGHSSRTLAAAGAVGGIDTTATANNVQIVDFSLTDGEVAFGIEGDASILGTTAGAGSAAGRRIYSSTAAQPTMIAVLEYCDDLESADWQTLKDADGTRKQYAVAVDSATGRFSVKGLTLPREASKEKFFFKVVIEN